MAKMKCECGATNIAWLVVSCAVLGAGAMLLIHAVLLQWTAGGMNPQIWLWYSGSLLVLSLGCCMKRKACAGCPMHS
ncbi:hypothetical protein HY490_04165 [Candidatus Woesearchaeota archaeon]|nr:hypothetical protein [Candidatus Woesearchaeota archaeon]